MQRSTHSMKFICDDQGNVAAACFGAAFSSSHEWGIERLQYKWECHHPNEYGLDRYKVQRVAVGLHILEGERTTCLSTSFSTWKNRSGYSDRPPHSSLVPQENETCVFAWDSSDFAIYATDDASRKHLRDLHTALLRKDAAILAGPSGVSDTGLVILIASRIPQEVRDFMDYLHLEQHRLQECVEAIEEKVSLTQTLMDAKLEWHALDPRFKDDEDFERETAYEVVFWLNPMAQQIYHMGLFSVEELLLWAQGKGPIIR